MEKYIAVLERVAQKELLITIFAVTALLVVIVLVWVSNYFYFKKTKKKFPEKHNLPKQIKIRRQSILASAVLSALCVGFIAFFIFDYTGTVSDIKKDVKDSAYVTYVGDYDVFVVRSAVNRFVPVYFDGGYAYMYMQNLSDKLSVETGGFNGKIVYGKNSLIIVEKTENK